MLCLEVRDPSGRSFTLNVPIPVTTLNFATFEEQADPGIWERFDQLADNNLDVVVPSKAAEELLSKQSLIRNLRQKLRYDIKE